MPCDLTQNKIKNCVYIGPTV